jgi:excinuclease ABC subunit A
MRVSGVSGSGKTTSGETDIVSCIKKVERRTCRKSCFHKNLEGDVDYISQVEMVDQNPIGKAAAAIPLPI